MPSKNKTENKTVAEKPVKALSAKRQTEQDHLNGKHKSFSPEAALMLAKDNPTCGFCVRRPAKNVLKENKAKAYFAANKGK